ncbi:proline dehydrogenase family protein [Naasia lichenicola]|uniref:L-glutamate gamma-semialdehyde dehydrogenase n=1 Tax=Naasia lichenicola TaxID=2565933 RepID=A0A4S4FHL4_9MICO|nr:bifunctional proline dehydrogenase/L-glutamate gamma-semialdehyde dehydrogenase [Naasia lichenicola]THG28526.1 aldehyde dehydrogenase family protein [Naasia lichenicola]
MTELAPPPIAPTPSDAGDLDLVDESIALVERWLREAASATIDPSGARLAGVLKDSKGLDFTVGFVDGVVRPEDLRVAARNLSRVAPLVPGFLPLPLRAAVRLGGWTAPILPAVVVPIARRVLRRMVGHLIVDATESRLGPAIAKIRTPGVRLNMNLLGEAVLGEREAGRRLNGTLRLLGRSDVDYVSIKVSAAVAPHAPWAFDESVADVVERLRPLFARAAASRPRKFINLDMEEFKDLDLTIAVFTRLLDEPDFRDLEAGIVLQAYLPDALAAMIRLQQWSAARRARGGAGIKVRLVKGANLPMEQVEASVHGWPLATWSSKRESDTNYKRVLDYALRPDRIANVRLGVAGHNLFDIAFAWLLAGRRGVRSGIEFEMLLGMAQGQAEAVRREVGSLLLYVPVVAPAEFDVAIAYLVRRLEEGASKDNFMSAVFEMGENAALFERERERFLGSVAELDAVVPVSHRVADRFAAVERAAAGRFENTPDTDPAVADNRAWVSALLARAPGTTLGQSALAAARMDSESQLDAVLKDGATAGQAWGALAGAERGRVLHRVGDVLEAHRADLIEIMVAEGGKTVDQADPEVSEAIDFAHYYAELASELDQIPGARFVPAGVTLVTPPWNFPVAIPTGSALAALAAGSAVVFKPAPVTARCGAVIAEALWEAGIPRDVLQLVDVGERELGRQLISHPMVDRVILTGAYETAELFRSFRPDLPLLAETSGKNAIIVTPSADLDAAVKDVVASAFGHAGQKCSAASLVVLVGSVASSSRFRSQLLDAVSSLVVGRPEDPTTRMGPLVETPGPKLLEGLTALGPGERWLVQPRRLDDAGTLWSPGVRDGVARGSAFHRIEYFGPILGIMTAATLDEAIELVNDVDYGLTSGLHSLDGIEIGRWLDRIEAGNLYVNRGITGAIVRRQPFGGWKKSAVGPGAKAGGPNYLLGLGTWEADGATAHPEEDESTLNPLVERLLAVASAELPPEQAASVRAGALSDQTEWSARFGRVVDPSGVAAEHNLFRYRPTLSPVVIRADERASQVDVLRVLAAGLRSGSRLAVSTAVELPGPVRELIRESGGSALVETDELWSAHIANGGGVRVRYLGAADRVAALTGGRPDVAVWSGPVLGSGRLELLPFLLEQAVSITAHRFGTPSAVIDGVVAELMSPV